MSHRIAISKQTEPREVRDNTQWQQAQSQHVHLGLHSGRDPASVPKERWHHTLGLRPWDTKEDCIVPTGSLPALLTLPAPSTTCGNWDDLAKRQHPPWAQCWSILTELLLTALSTSQRASQQILHYEMCSWLLPLVFHCGFLSLTHACLHASTLSVFNCSSFLKYTSAETQSKDSSQPNSTWGTIHFTSMCAPYLKFC